MAKTKSVTFTREVGGREVIEMIYVAAREL